MGADQPAERKAIERHTAIKVWIRQLIEGSYVTNPGWESNYVIYGEAKVSRANVVGVVVQRSASKVMNYDYVAIDDGTGRIVVRAFENHQMLQSLEVGDLVNVIGRPREYGNEVYLMPEIARKIDDPLWVEVRKRELNQVFAQPATQKEETKKTLAEQKDDQDSLGSDDASIVTPRDKLLAAIRALDNGEGVDVETILAQGHGTEAEKLLQRMLLRGDIFEIRPGRIKLLE